MKKNKTNKENSKDDFYDDEFSYNKKHARSLRLKEKSQARRKIDAYLERKSLKELFDDYTDMDNYLDDSPGMSVDDYLEELDRVDYGIQSDYPDFRI